jgi:hypothetical protein
MANVLYSLVAGHAELDATTYSGSFSTQPYLWEFRGELQDPKQGLLRTKPSLAKLGDLVGFYHFMAGITTEGTEPTHGFSHRKPTFRMMEIADYFYQQGVEISKVFSHEWFIAEGNRRRTRVHGVSPEDQTKVRSIATQGMIEDVTHLRAFVNGTKAIALSAWQDFSERAEISDTERKFALNKVDFYRVVIVNDIRRGEFDEGLAEDPTSRPSPSLIGKIQFFPGRAE